MSGIEHHVDRAVRRSDDSSLVRLYRGSGAEDALRKGRVGNLRQRHDRSGDRRGDRDAGLGKQVFQLAKHDTFTLFLHWTVVHIVCRLSR